MAYGIYLKVTSTGTHGSPLLLNDIYPVTDGHTAFRRAGPVYVPVNGEIILTYTGEVAASHESGTIRGFVDQGYITTLVYGGTEVVPFVPTGSVQMFAAAAAPLGYLLCDGAAVSRTLYADLFAVIGVTYGAGNGTTTFNLPDLRGRAPIGAGNGVGLTPRALASTGGAETVTLTTAEMPSHTHTHNANGGAGSGASPATGLAYSDGQNTAGAGLDATNGELNLYTTPIALTINSTGGGGAHANMQPFLALNFIIKT
jgi:microcystin-dependent protein